MLMIFWIFQICYEEDYQTDNFKVTVYELNHGSCKPINGYMLEKNEQNGWSDFKNMLKKYPHTKFFGIHYSKDYDLTRVEGIEFLDDGESVEIGED